METGNQLKSFDGDNLKKLIVQEADSLGFDACGFSEAELLKTHSEMMEQWLEKDFQGEMSYLERNRQKRYDPRELVENTKTIITVLQNYFPSETLSEHDNYKISKYAYGKDYHFVVKDKLRQLLAKIEQVTGPLQARVFTDSAPVLDRAWAEKSGLGFIGKNTCLIHPRKGSFFFIGHIFLPIEIMPENIPVTDYCGTCTRCIDACPTKALVDAHTLDARKCISYLTIEQRGPLTAELKLNFKDWIFGCDICQDVCPWNRFANPHHEPLFELSGGLKNMKKTDWHQLTKEQYNSLFKDAAIERTKFEGLKRNIDFLKD